METLGFRCEARRQRDGTAPLPPTARSDVRRLAARTTASSCLYIGCGRERALRATSPQHRTGAWAPTREATVRSASREIFESNAEDAMTTALPLPARTSAPDSVGNNDATGTPRSFQPT